jgi:ribosomal protein S18 acetylase RimI-like enzyme
MNSIYKIKPLTHISFDEIYACNLLAFKDYPFQWSKADLQKAIYRRGFDPSLSFGAFYNNELVSFTLNGIGYHNDLKTAYDTGTGTVPAHRGKKLASKIFEHSIPFLKAVDIQQYILEVLEENKVAFGVYEKQGFRISRKFDCFRVNMSEWKKEESTLPDGLELKEINFSYQSQMEAMVDFRISWQNDFQALLKAPQDFIVLGVFKKNKLIGFGIIDPGAGDVPQLAITPNERQNGIGSFLISELKKRNKAEILKVVNIESNQHVICKFMEKQGIPKIVSQYEMILSI